MILKNKVKRLEMAASQSGSMTLGTNNTTRGSRVDVDSQAGEELEYMSSVRRMAIEELSDAHQSLTEKHEKLVEKYNGSKARVRTLESDAAKHKQQLKIILDKSENDDKLIEALKTEVQRLKAIEVRSSKGSGGPNVDERVQRAAKEAASMATSHMDGELTRLRRLVKQQGEQLATQEELIKELRKEGRSGNSY